MSGAGRARALIPVTVGLMEGVLAPLGDESTRAVDGGDPWWTVVLPWAVQPVTLRESELVAWPDKPNLNDGRRAWLRAAVDALAPAPPSPSWTPLTERWPGDGEVVWVSDGCGVWFAEAGETYGPDALRYLRGATPATVVYDHQPLCNALSWTPASVPEPPEEGEVQT